MKVGPETYVVFLGPHPNSDIDIYFDRSDDTLTLIYNQPSIIMAIMVTIPTS